MGILLVSVGLLIAAAGWSVGLVKRQKDWRLAFLPVLFASMAAGVALPLAVPEFTGQAPRTALGLAVSLMSLVALYFLDRSLGEHRRGAEGARVSECRYRTLIETVPHGIQENDTSGIITLSNAAHHQMLGYEPGELVGKAIWDLLDSDAERETLRQYLLNLVKERPPPSPYLTRAQTKSGQAIDVQVDWNYLRDPAGRVTGFISIITDMTERRRVEADLRRSDQRVREQLDELEQLYQTAPVGRCFLDSDLRYGRINEHLAAANGRPVAEHIGRAIHEIIPEFAKRVEPVLRGVIETGQPVLDFEVQAEKQDEHGVRRTWLSSYFPVKSTNGDLRGINAVVQDISKQKRFEAALRASEARQNALLRAVPDMMLTISRDGVFQDYRPSRDVAEFIPPSQFLGRKVTEIMPLDHAAVSLDKIAQTLDTGETQLFEYQLPMADGTRDYEARYAASDDNEVMILVRDISGRKRAERALQAHARQQAVVAELGQRALRTADVSACLELAVNLVAETLEAEFCKVLELLPAQTALLLRAGTGWREGLVGRVTVGAGADSQAGYTLLSSQPVIVEDLRTETRFSGPPLLHDHRVVSGVSVIIHGPERPFGVLGAHTTRRRTFSEDDIHFLQAIANVLAAAIQRARDEQALRRSEETWRSMTVSTPDYIVMVDCDGKLLFINRTPPGLRVEQIIGTSIYQYVSEECGQVIKECFQRVIETHRPDRFEVQYEGLDGRVSWYHSSVGPVLQDGKVVALTVNSQDITARKEAERAIRESEEKWRSLTQNAPDIITTVDREGKILFINRMLPPLSWEEVIGQSAFEFVRQEYREDVRRCIERVFQSGKSCGCETRPLEHLGTSWYFNRFGPVKRGEQVVAVTIVSTNITERKEAEAALRRQAQILEQVHDAVVSTDLEGVVQTWNAGAERVFGYSAAETVGRNLEFLYFPEDLADLRGRVLPTVRSKGLHQCRLRNRPKHGQPIFVDLRFSLLRDSGDAPVGIIACCSDITKRKVAEEKQQALEAQLRQAQKLEAVGVLVGGIAHDFNNILTSIVGFAHLLQDELARGSEERANVDEILKAGQRATDLVRQMLAFSRRADYEKQPVEIGPVVQETLNLLRPSVPPAVEIRQQIAAGCGAVLGDATQIHQIAMNLCTNACQAMAHSGGTLEVTLRPVDVGAELADTRADLRQGSYVQLTVSDTGPGIDPAVRERIFEPFFTTKKPGEGTGLGLSVVHGIVTAHGGAIVLEGGTTGRGATFRVYLPRLRGVAAAQRDVPERLPTGSGRILFVDDEEAISRLSRQMLERLGYQVTVLDNAAAALQAFTSDSADFDLVISDVSMPGASGLELARRLKDIRSDIPIVLTTGFSELLTPKEARSLGISSVLPKPFGVADLGKAVRQGLRRRKTA